MSEPKSTPQQIWGNQVNLAGRQLYVISDLDQSNFASRHVTVAPEYVLAIADGYRLSLLDPDKPVVVDLDSLEG